MCGIFGLVYTNEHSHKVSNAIEKLFKLTEPRGRQASGLAVLKDGQITTFKQPITASKMIKDKPYKDYILKTLGNSSSPTAVLGHCRLVTDGSELKNYHNQPILMKDLVGVHNGVINNFERIKDKYNLEMQGESDSEVLFRYSQMKNDEGQNPIDISRSFFQEMRGAASVGVLFAHYNILKITTNFGSLYYASVNQDCFFFTSEKKILIDFLESQKLNAQPTKLNPQDGVVIDLKTLEQTCFRLDKKDDHSNHTFSKKDFKVSDLSLSPDNIKRCTRCILPENYPFLTFDANGVCSICNKYQKQKYHGKDELNRFLDKYRSKDGSPDCLVGLSGGRDSSFGIHVLKNEFGMNPIGFCYDWLLTSRKARHNVAKMAGALDVEVIYRCGNYEKQAKNIRDNINGFLRDPDLGMMTFVQAGDKEMYHYGREIRKELGLDLTVWCSGYQLEQREFFIGYSGINKTLINNPRLYDYGWITKLRMIAFYGLKTLKNPYYWNSSILDNALAFWHCMVAKDDFLYLFNYYPWNESEVESVLKEKYEWEADTNYGVNQWRMDDFHTSFINYVYYTVGGFSEFDDFRSNQIREGLITRDEALRLTAIDNNIRYESLLEFSNLVGFNLEHVLKKIDSIPKLYKT